MRLHRPQGRQRLARTLTVAAFACGALVITGSAGATNSTEIDVMAWLAVSPAVTVDQSTNCMPGATGGATHSTDAVAYRNDRLVLRSSASDNSVKLLVNNALNAMYGTAINYVGPIERITFPTPPGSPPIAQVLSITLLPRPGALPHKILNLARKLRNEQHQIASPDYTLEPSGPYSFYWPHGYPEKTSTLTTPRKNLTPNGAPVGAGLKIGTGVKVEVYDTGQFAPDPVNLPTTTKLSGTDNDLVNLVNNGPLMVDFPAAGHATAIAGVLTTMTPGATIQDVRINDRSGLATDVSAARGMASSLRTLARADYPDLIINSFGTPACELNPAVPGLVLEPIGLEAVVEVVDKFDPSSADGMLIIASAGNMATTRPHYPAAFPSVLSVGALDATLDSDGNPWTSISKNAHIADFSNTGSWVKVYAPGVDLPTTHVNGYRFENGGDIILGKATVDGTSFSAPDTGSYLAELMSTTGYRARAAQEVLIAGGVSPLPKCGSTTTEQGKAIVLSSLTASITDPAGTETINC